MLESDAKAKWCPMVRQPHVDYQRGDGPTGCSINDPREVDSNCIGSECMMWRWSVVQGVSGRQIEGEHNLKDHGYCGLAGHPVKRF